MPPNIRKLIFSFLALAGGVLVVGLLFSPIVPPAAPIAQTAKSPTTPTSTFKVLPLADLATQSSLGSGKTYNITQNFAKNLASKFVEANTGGPKSVSGTPSLVLPSSTALQFAAEQTVASITPEEAGLTATIDDNEITVSGDASRAGALSYLHAIDGIVVNGNGDLAKLPSDPSPDFTAQAALLQQELSGVKNTPVPPPLVSFHKNLLLALTHSLEINNGVANGQDDPLKAQIMGTDGSQVVAYDIKNAQAAFDKIDWGTIGINPDVSSKDIGLLDLIIPRAHAQSYVPVRDFQAEDTLNTILSTVQDILKTEQDTNALLHGEWQLIVRTQQRKYNVVNRLQQDILNWVLADNNPQFIQNWQDYLQGAALYRAQISLEDLASANALDPEIQNGVLSFVQNSYLGESAFPQATLDAVISANCTTFGPQPGSDCTQQGFYDDFHNGGWAAYLALLEPQNNFPGATMIYSDIVAQESNLAQQAADSEAVASQGFLPKEVCVNSTAQNDCRTWAITLPGTKVADALDSAFQTAIDEIVNSQYIPDCIGAMWQGSLLNAVIGQGDQGFVGLANTGFTPLQCQIPSSDYIQTSP